MMTALVNDKVIQNVNHNFGVSFYLFLFLFFYKMDQTTNKMEGTG